MQEYIPNENVALDIVAGVKAEPTPTPTLVPTPDPTPTLPSTPTPTQSSTATPRPTDGIIPQTGDHTPLSCLVLILFGGLAWFITMIAIDSKQRRNQM